MLRRVHGVRLQSSLNYSCVRAFSTTLRSADDIAVIGGGITGLASAYHLSKERPSHQITLYEASPRLGGWVSSRRVEVGGGSVLFEEGPRTLRPGNIGEVTAALVQELGLIHDTVFVGHSGPMNKRYIYYPDHLVQVPPAGSIVEKVLAFFEEPIFKGVLLEALKEPWKNGKGYAPPFDESVGSFITRRTGRNIADRFAGALLHGIYAGDVWQLSMRSIFPYLAALEHKFGSMLRGRRALKRSKMALSSGTERQTAEEMKRFPWDEDFKRRMGESSLFYFKNGIQQLSERLELKLTEAKNVIIKVDSPIKTIHKDPDVTKLKISTDGAGQQDLRHDYVVSTIFSKKLASLCADHSGKPLLPSLSDTHAVTVMTVNLFYCGQDVRPPNIRGFGYLIPQTVPFINNPEHALGVVFDADVATQTDTVKGTKMTVMLGGHYWDGWSSYPDKDEGRAMALALIRRHLNIRAQPDAVNVHLHHECIPQYTVGHTERMGVAHEHMLRAFNGQLSVAGSSYTGVSVNDCLNAGRIVPRNLGKTGLEQFVFPSLPVEHSL